MILEEEIFKAYGHYPSELTHESNKPILAACDKCGITREASKHSYHLLCRSCVHKGKKLTEEHKAKISAAQKGNTYGLGFKHTEEAKAKISMNRAAPKGGISFEPYCAKFNEEFKEYIRSKFGYKCFLCPTTQAENSKKLSVHHVNYNKNCGCDGDETCNFVPLCKKCHAKTNGNRDYWQKLITDKLHCLIIGWDV